MKYIIVSALLCGISSLGAFAQSGQSSERQQSTSATNTRQANPTLKRSPRQQRRMGAGQDTTLPKKPARTNRKQRRLPPDSLRRGGVTRIDTV